MTTKDIHLKLKLPVGSKLDRVLAVVRKRMKRQKFLSGPAEAHVHFVDDSDKSAHARKSDAFVILHECNRNASIDFQRIVVTGGSKEYDFKHDIIEVDIIFKGSK